MRIRGGHTIEVYRAVERDRHGDKSDELVGTIDHVVFQWASAASVGLRFKAADEFQESSSLSAVVFAPRTAGILLQARDRIKLNGEWYQVIGDRAWNEEHPATGHDFGYYMMQVEMVS